MGVHAGGKSLAGEEMLPPLLGARAAAYELLSQLFAEEPAAGFLEFLARQGVIRDFPFAASSSRIRDGVALASAYIDQPANRQGEGLERLRWEFTRMFVGPEKLVAPPWESVYVSGERLLFQLHTLTVRQAYLKYGLLPERFLREADDHLALELEFMGHLSRLAEAYARRGREAGDSAEDVKGELNRVLKDQKAFLEQHLLKWVPLFAADVWQGAETDFYKGVAMILEGFVELDHALVAELLEAMP